MEFDFSNINVIEIPRELNSFTVIQVIEAFEKFFMQNSINVAMLNFKNTKFVYPGGLTPLLAYLKEYALKNDATKNVIIDSSGSLVDKYIRRMGFYSLLGLKDNYNWNKFTSFEKFQEPYYFSKDTNVSEINNKVSNIISVFIKDRNVMNYNEAIGWCINEIMDNAQNHANSDTSVIMAQSYNNTNTTEFCVSDRGIGIRESMGEIDTISAMEKCITKAKGKNSDGAGNGLFYTTELIKNDTSGKCSMSIWSEDYLLTLYSNSEPQIKKVPAYWQGVSIKILMYNGISTSIEQLTNGHTSFAYDDMPEYYERLFKN